jgi:hypothetical protein
MAVNFKIVEDNTAPSYVITCTRNGTAIDLSAATDVQLIIQRKSDSTITQSGKSASITTPSSGVITYTADATDFPSAGLYVADVQVTYSGGGVERLYNQAKWKVRRKIS